MLIIWLQPTPQPGDAVLPRSRRVGRYLISASARRIGAWIANMP